MSKTYRTIYVTRDSPYEGFTHYNGVEHATLDVNGVWTLDSGTVIDKPTVIYVEKEMIEKLRDNG